jgi:hypothetical protein
MRRCANTRLVRLKAAKQLAHQQIQRVVTQRTRVQHQGRLMQQPKRNLRGYGPHLPAVRWPEGHKVAVSFVVNFEEGGEFSMRDGDPVNEGVYEVSDRLDVPAPCIDSHFEFGTRVGWWRVADLFDAH